ncbi:hypothetical protein CAC42_1263 [Sphaceloma murrayae]|uniref:Myb-like domain-containing protein n=1 Tax=Sphaceloma murrayae TaxID=2082308 RepID=A0A2K1R2G5_9PEZI|nr:hypothetical protein CAC42_1263 [Sphaceloma murrayae]
MVQETRLRRPSSATTASSSTETVGSQHSRAGSRSSSAAAAVWTAADDDVLASARAAGMNWQPIATRFFPTKSANACRKRHERLMDRRYQEEWEQDRLEELATAYFDCRKEMWTILGERLGERWGLVEGKCMEKGLKNLQTIARASQRKRIRRSERDETRSERDQEDDSGSQAFFSTSHRDKAISVLKPYRTSSSATPTTTLPAARLSNATTDSTYDACRFHYDYVESRAG